MKTGKLMPFISGKEKTAEILLLSVLLLYYISSSWGRFTQMLNWEAENIPYLMHQVPKGIADSFESLVTGVFSFLPGYIVMCIGIAVIHYFTFREGSMAVYTMKRLKSRWELHRRCLTVPLLAILTALLVTAGLLLLFHSRYMSVIPAELIPADSSFDIWRLFV
ncbi:MAG: hypothetical protein IJL94_02805 [Erysipelotrichaceae bacterium]|nr:hypothetical protein [Erysipelotrichaceae bacterium]